MNDPFRLIAEFAETYGEGRVPSDSLHTMRLCVLDWVLCGLGAKHDPITIAVLGHAAQDQGSCGLFHSDHSAGPRMAALVNGTISHALDFDDTHFGHIGHVSTVVVPAALAAAQANGRDFEAFLTAARLGAEAALRFGLWFGRSHYQAGWHQTATAGAYGASVAAALLLDAPIRPALSIVAGMAAGQKAQFGSAMKPMNAGVAAAHGVEAAQLAKLGLSGSDDVAAGVLATQSGEGNLSAFEGLGQDWLFDSVSHKYHACCHGTHAMIEALLALAPHDPDAIEKIEVTTHPRWLTVCNKPAPTTWLEGKFSYKFLAALVVQGGGTIGAEPEAFFPLSDRSRQLMDRVIVTTDDPVTETATDVRVKLCDGAVRHMTHDLATPDDLVIRRAKLREKGDALIGERDTASVVSALDAGDLAALTAAMRSAAG